MKIEIQGYWNAKVQTVKSYLEESAEEFMQKHGKIQICDIIINGKAIAGVFWDGKEVSILRSLEVIP